MNILNRLQAAVLAILMLGTLTGKQKRYATHADAPFRTCSAPSTRSSTISRALWRSLTMPAICPHKYEPSS